MMRSLEEFEKKYLPNYYRMKNQKKGSGTGLVPEILERIRKKITK